ncbi:MAG: hypothetical protein AAFO95_14755 [Cyanobacteria bacterium J06600_6]
MLGIGYLIKQGVKSVVNAVTEDEGLAVVVGTSAAIILTGGLSLADDVIEHGVSALADSGTIIDDAEILRQGE